jgi:hypothetical protein
MIAGIVNRNRSNEQRVLSQPPVTPAMVKFCNEEGARAQVTAP